MQNILDLKYEYNSILTSQLIDQLVQVKQCNFEFSNEPDTLPCQLRGQQATRAIHKIKSGTGAVLTDPNQ